MDERKVFEKSFASGNRNYSFKVVENEVGYRTTKIQRMDYDGEWNIIEGELQIPQEDMTLFDESLCEAFKDQIKGIYPRHGSLWTTEEEAHLRDEITRGSTLSELATLHQRTPNSIIIKVKVLKLLKDLSLRI